MANLNDQVIYSPNTNIYKYTASIKYVVGSKVYDINDGCINSIAIDNNYDDMNMPMIFITMNIYQTLVNKMVVNQHNGIFILNIKRAIINSDMPDLYSEYINDKFVYFISGEYDRGVSNDEDIPDEDKETQFYSSISVGLLSCDHVNKNKKMINCVLKGKQSSILYYITSHLPILIEPPTNNKYFDQLVIPPISSISKTIRYINQINTLYDTKYRFFIDFDRSYLISSSGKIVRAKDDKISSIHINIYNRDTAESAIQGMTTDYKNSLYNMNVSSKDCSLSDNNLYEKSFSEIIATDTSGNTRNSKISVSQDASIRGKSKAIRLQNDNTNMLNNIVSTINNSAIQIMVQKTDIDSSIFTINKEYIIRADSAYNTEDYNGRYILARKRELYIKSGDNYTMSTMLLFRKVM